MGYILHEIDIGGFYAGTNKKYNDIFNISPARDGAKVFNTEEEARKIKSALEKAGYKFIIELTN